MADRYQATISFPAHLLDAEIKELLEQEGVEFDPLRARYDMEVEVENGIFTLINPQARWGRFEELENLLKTKGVPFDRESDAYFEYAAELAIFRPAAPGVPALDMFFPLLNMEPAISVYDLRKLMTQGLEALQAYLDANFPAYPPLSQYVGKTPCVGCGALLDLRKDGFGQDPEKGILCGDCWE